MVLFISIEPCRQVTISSFLSLIDQVAVNVHFQLSDRFRLTTDLIYQMAPCVHSFKFHKHQFHGVLLTLPTMSTLRTCHMRTSLIKGGGPAENSRQKILKSEASEMLFPAFWGYEFILQGRLVGALEWYCNQIVRGSSDPSSGVKEGSRPSVPRLQRPSCVKES